MAREWTLRLDTRSLPHIYCSPQGKKRAASSRNRRHSLKVSRHLSLPSGIAITSSFLIMLPQHPSSGSFPAVTPHQSRSRSSCDKYCQRMPARTQEHAPSVYLRCSRQAQLQPEVSGELSIRIRPQNFSCYTHARV